MTSTATRWFKALTPHTVVLAAAAAALIGTAGAASASTAASAAPSHTVAASAVASKQAEPAAKDAPKPAAKNAASKSIKHGFQLQNTFFNCGPSATRVALSAHGKWFTQSQVGAMLGTTEDGTDSAHVVTGVMNKQLGKNRYHTVEIPGQKATKQQINRLKTDVVTAITHGDPIVANIAGTVSDTAGDAHSYEGGHYLPIVGYGDNGNTVKIADSADTVGSPYYSVHTDDMANWIASRGYSA